jgi:fructokinase
MDRELAIVDPIRHSTYTTSLGETLIGLPFGGIDAGGTTWTCVVGFSPADIRARANIQTTSPAETMSRVVEFFFQHGPLAGVGVGSFGPVDLDTRSETWGHIRATPKEGWVDIDVACALGRELGVPVAFDTDVNVAALGEHRWGAARGVETFCYITVGTGIGAGIMANGRLLHGLQHPELGHMRVPHDLARDPFPGACSFHGDCLEGLASGEAIRLRWGVSAEAQADLAAWELIADYIAVGIVNTMSILSPSLVVLGGGVMQRPGLLDLVRARVTDQADGYFHQHLRGVIDRFVVPASLGSDAGALGAIELARGTAPPNLAPTPTGRNT